MMTRVSRLIVLLALAVTATLVNAASQRIDDGANLSIAQRDSYQVQVGDVVRIVLPGEESLDKNFDVDRQGRIVLPEVGAVKVVGISEQALEEKVRKQLELVFRDLGNLRVFLKERRVLVNVLGYVKKPGEINLSSSAGIQMALRQAGGLRAGAQLDKMQLRRGKKDPDL